MLIVLAISTHYIRLPFFEHCQEWIFTQKKKQPLFLFHHHLLSSPWIQPIKNLPEKNAGEVVGTVASGRKIIPKDECLDFSRKPTGQEWKGGWEKYDLKNCFLGFVEVEGYQFTF